MIWRPLVLIPQHLPPTPHPHNMVSNSPIQTMTPITTADVKFPSPWANQRDKWPGKCYVSIWSIHNRVKCTTWLFLCKLSTILHLFFVSHIILEVMTVIIQRLLMSLGSPWPAVPKRATLEVQISDLRLNCACLQVPCQPRGQILGLYFGTLESRLTPYRKHMRSTQCSA